MIQTENIRIRPATLEDCLLFFHWKNDPVTLANSFQSAEVPLENHTAWFQRALQNKALLLLVGETGDGTPIGQVRFDTEAQRAVVGITVAPSSRGKRLGTPLLSAGCAFYWKEVGPTPIDAFIKTANEASRKTFAASGFIFQETTKVFGHEAIRMTLYP